MDTVDNFIDTEIADIQARLPAALVSGRIDASIGAAAANTITASALAADAVSEIQSGLATAAALDAVDNFIDTEIAAILADTDDIQTRLPAALVGGRMDASVGAMAANVMTAAAAAADLTTELQSGLATQASVDTIDDFLDTEIAAIKAKTDLIPGTIDGKTFTQLVTLFASVLLGKASGLDTTTAIYRAIDDSKDRVTATVTADGNRSAITLDAA